MLRICKTFNMRYLPIIYVLFGLCLYSALLARFSYKIGEEKGIKKGFNTALDTVTNIVRRQARDTNELKKIVLVKRDTLVFTISIDGVFIKQDGPWK